MNLKSSIVDIGNDLDEGITVHLLIVAVLVLDIPDPESIFLIEHLLERESYELPSRSSSRENKLQWGISFDEVKYGAALRRYNQSELFMLRLQAGDLDKKAGMIDRQRSIYGEKGTTRPPDG